jgi:hypothetical protein
VTKIEASRIIIHTIMKEAVQSDLNIVKIPKDSHAHEAIDEVSYLSNINMERRYCGFKGTV